MHENVRLSHENIRFVFSSIMNSYANLPHATDFGRDATDGGLIHDKAISCTNVGKVIVLVCFISYHITSMSQV